MTFPADTYSDAVDLSITASNQLHKILNGDSTTEITVEDGSKIPSVRKAYTDSLFFLSPQPWTVGEYETVYNQLRAFVEPTGITTWWFSKPATVSTPVLMSTTPHEDSNWTLWNAINNSVYETQKRLAAEAGFNMVGSFLLGATVTNTGDVVFYETDGKYYGWEGSLPKDVAVGATPATSGGIGAGAWADRTDVTLRDDINIVVKRFASVEDMVADMSLQVSKIVETKSYYAGWAALQIGPRGMAEYWIVDDTTYNALRKNTDGPGASGNGSGLVDHRLDNGFIAYLLPNGNGRINIDQCSAYPDCDTTDNTGLTGTDSAPAINAADTRGIGIDVPVGNYRIAQEINITTDGGGLYGAGWFKSRLFYTQTEGSGACIKTNNENITISDLGVSNLINVGIPNSRENFGIKQETGGNLGLNTVYVSGFGYNMKIGNYFADRIISEFAKQVAIWDYMGRKSNLTNVTVTGSRVSMRVGDNTNNTQCQDKAYSNITLEATASNTTWQAALEPIIDIVGKSAHTQWKNIRLINPYGAAVRINNTYQDGGSVLSESCHEFSGIKVRNNRDMTGYTKQDTFDIANSSNVLILDLDTHQPTSSQQGFDGAVNIRDANTFVRIDNSSIGGASLSISNNSVKGFTSQCTINNTEYNYGGDVFKAGTTQEDGHATVLGNKSGSVNLTIDFGRTIQMTLTGDVTMTNIVNNASKGDRVRLKFIQDATGGRTVSFNSPKWKASLAATSGAANTTMTVDFEYDGTYMVQIGASSPWMV